jgi:nitronate monooxygenase
VLDDIQGTPIWPGIYDGRALTGKSWQDHAAGMPLEENIRLFNEADKAGDASRKITWVCVDLGDCPLTAANAFPGEPGLAW